MHAVTWRALQHVPKHPRNACRIVAGQRHPIPRRNFHRSAIAYRSPGNPVDSTDPTWKQDGEAIPEPQDAEAVTAEAAAAGPEAVGAEESPGSSFVEKFQKAKELNYGSAVRRAARNRRPKEIPPVVLPEWFLKRNVKLKEELKESDESIARIPEASSDTIKLQGTEQPSGAIPSGAETELHGPGNGAFEGEARYALHGNIRAEIIAVVRAGLSLPKPPFVDSFPAAKSNLLLHCPKDGGTYFLESIVEDVASIVGADLVRLDAQDIAEMSGNYLGEGSQPTPNPIRSLGYDVQQITSKQAAEEQDEEDVEEEDLEEQDEYEGSSSRKGDSSSAIPTFTKVTAVPLGSLAGKLEDMMRSGKLLPNAMSSRGRLNESPAQWRNQRQLGTDQHMYAKMSALVEAFIDSNLAKRAAAHKERDAEKQGDVPTTFDSQAEVADVTNASAAGRLIIAIRDYKELNSTLHGGELLGKLHEVVHRRRKEGQSVILIGTSSSADLIPSLTISGIQELQAEGEDGLSRTIIVPPLRTASSDQVFANDNLRRTWEINVRHLADMNRRLGVKDMNFIDPINGEPYLRQDATGRASSILESSTWPFEGVHRVAQISLGLSETEEEITSNQIPRAMGLLHDSDEVKFQWAAEEKQIQKSPQEGPERKRGSVVAPITHKESEERMKKLRKTCNTHEKKLLNGVVNPENIHTTFSNVRAPPETVEALKTLTSLSLIRPEAFSYGVLATDKIPGLLLYGPPGTGKTLLAKAVAKESGATVLEVSGSEVYDMYVGEGEKNVKAIFSLAKKLEPCIVFIDEADAIFGSRGGHANRTSHRELINQFLREWDGMNDLSAFIMVATNRPFDLDDAVLRRLPRRLLVDLPVEKDREAILTIHLKDEALDASVSLSDLAAHTPLYSGSDLKNLAVAAALQCVNEEVDASSRHQGSEPYVFPEKRTLTKRHFDKAIDEISASISEDMSSLSAIKKFDEKYGDRKGRRKKSAGWGFGTLAEAEKGAETGRVRA
ncbi:MAG: hypothetical protein M1827_005088 [Pycnora praestabilis]|nr:MAG: hypothetical protein M1827_005088 [Pycnora praestabilis]